MQIELAGEALLLDADRALVWPRTATVMVADVHLGKAAAFRRLGIAVPSGSSSDDLLRLERLVERHRAQRLLVLGDLFHTRLEAGDGWLRCFDDFRQRHPGLCLQVIRGNHDREPERVPQHWKLEWREAPQREGPFAFMHEAAPRRDGAYAIGGHVHPAITLASGRDRLRLPVFWIRPHYSVLPSFGSFTGGYAITPEADDRLVGVSPTGLVDISGRHKR